VITHPAFGRIAAAVVAGALLVQATNVRAQAAAPVAAVAAPTALTTPDEIVAVARATAGSHTGRTDPSELEIRPPDPRLRLAACAEPLRGVVAPGTRSATRLAVEVSCPRPVWRHYVQVQIVAQEPVVVAARPIARGQPITAEDLDVVPRELSGLAAGYFRSADDVVGRVAQRAIGAGDVVGPGAAKAPTLIRRGQQVTLLARASSLQVRVDAVALADGGLAERVRVRNSSTGRQVEGIVRSADTVEVALE
jgi:flagella basal body P-ring formation protein FlgA